MEQYAIRTEHVNVDKSIQRRGVRKYIRSHVTREIDSNPCDNIVTTC
jgi:hypothetical protein